MPAAQHPVFKQPDNLDAVIWRYMDFTKFISMLETKSLYFARSDLLGDPFEGSISRASEESRLKKFDTILEVNRADAIANFRRAVQSMRQRTFVNCWHMNEHESAAMWKLYAKSEEAVAIKSRFNLLLGELNEEAFVGTVDYINFEEDPIPGGNLLYPYVYKRLSFAHEREVRAVIIDLHSDYAPNSLIPCGVEQPVNLANLIELIYVAPTCSKWFADLVRMVCRRYSVSATVHQSSLDAEPFF